MLLIKLDSNLPNFHTVEFEKGVNFIVGRRYNPNDKDNKDSYNGVGKSLIIELIHFCLGSNKVKPLNKLGEYNCSLIVQANNINYEIKREFNDNQQCYFAGVKISLTDLKEKLNELSFPLTTNMSYRNLISRFIRRHKADYTKCLNFIKKEPQQVELLHNSFLLGIPHDLVINKINNKDSKKILNQTKKSLESDSLLKKYFNTEIDINIRLKDLDGKIKELENKIKHFKVIDNYTDVKNQLDFISTEIKKLTNKKNLLKNNLKKIENNINTNITKNIDLNNLYNETAVELPTLIVKQIEDVYSFHNKMIQTRKETFISDKIKYQEEIESIDVNLKTLNIEFDKLSSLLNSGSVMDDYALLINKYNETLNIYQKMLDYQNLKKEYNNKIAKNKKEKIEIQIGNQKFLDENEELLDTVMNVFRSFSILFYNDKPSGLSITTNSKDNKLSFDINPNIEGDSSDGINEVKIFCYDMTNLFLMNHNVKFLFHDSRLLSNIDPRQRLTILDIIRGKFSNTEFQYISSINEDTIISLKDVTTEEKFKDITSFINDNTILTLTDASEKTKLLGFNINLEYDN